MVDTRRDSFESGAGADAVTRSLGTVTLAIVTWAIGTRAIAIRPIAFVAVLSLHSGVIAQDGSTVDEPRVDLEARVEAAGRAPSLDQVEELAKFGLASLGAVRSVHGSDLPVYWSALVRFVVEAELAESAADDAGVRFEGQYSRLQQTGEDGVRVLAEMFLDEDRPLEVRRRAGIALTDVDAKSVVPLLRDAANDFLTEEWVRREASYVLARNGDRSVLEKRLARLRDVAKEEVSTANLGQILAAIDELGEIHHRVGEYDAAIREHEKRRLILIEVGARLPEDLRTGIEEEIKRMHYDLACSLSRAGRLEEALDALALSIESSSITLAMVNVDGDLENLRSTGAYTEWRARQSEDTESPSSHPRDSKPDDSNSPPSENR